MAFTTKDWKDYPDTSTPITAAALEDLETRVTDYGNTYVTSLPSSPMDGQEVYYAADATNGIIWHLRYRSGSSDASSYKWEFVGGAPVVAEVNGIQTAAGSVSNLTANIPLVGWYFIESGIRAQRTNGDFAVELKVRNPADTSTITDQAWVGHGAFTGSTVTSARATGSGVCKKELTVTGDYIGDVVDLGNNPDVIGAWMKFTPIKVK